MKLRTVLIALFPLLFCISVPSAADEFSPDSITNIMRKVAKYRLSKGVNKYGDNFSASWNWDAGAYMTGISALYRHTKDKMYLDSIVKWSQVVTWSPKSSNPDEECCAQTFCETYLLDPKTENAGMYKPWLDRFTNDFFTHSANGASAWYWCDALYMAPPAIAMLCPIMNSTRYLDTLVKCWGQAQKALYDTAYHLYFRDGGFIFSKCKDTAWCIAENGGPVFWGPGNGWVIGGLARVLKYMPASYGRRDTLVRHFREYCGGIAKYQQGNGMWTSSLLDTLQWPKDEASGTAFFVFGFAWGINNGILDPAVYTPITRKAWSALVKCVDPADGKLKFCQTIDMRPSNDIFTYYSSSEGEGAFLLAGEEMYKLVTTPVGIRSLPCVMEKNTVPSQVMVSVTDLRTDFRIHVPAGAQTVALYDSRGRIVARDWCKGESGFRFRDLAGVRASNGVYIVKFR